MIRSAMEFGVPAWVGIFTVIGVVVLWLVRQGYSFLRSLVHLTDLIVGTPTVGTIAAQPGLAERLRNIEVELKTNGGSSLRDLVSTTLTLARTNALSVEQAKQLAETAAAKAEENARLLAESEGVAKRERLMMQKALDSLMNALDDFAKETHAHEMGTLRALKAAGLPIADIVEGELDADH